MLQSTFGALSLRYAIAAVAMFGVWATARFLMASRALQADVAKAAA